MTFLTIAFIVVIAAVAVGMVRLVSGPWTRAGKARRVERRMAVNARTVAQRQQVVADVIERAS